MTSVQAPSRSHRRARLPWLIVTTAVLVISIMPTLGMVTPAAKEVSALPARYQIRVERSDGWSAASGAAWARLQDSGGAGSGVMEIVVEANPTAVDRSTTIWIGGEEHRLLQRAYGTAMRELRTFGANDYGQLGDNRLTDSARPARIATGVVAMAAGSAHSLYVTDSGTLWAMGENAYGQLGDGTTIARSVPVKIADGVQSVAAGDGHSAFLKRDGTLWTMGDNWAGQLGDGSTTKRLIPVMVASSVTAVTAGKAVTLFLKTDGFVWGMGSNSQSELTNRTSPGAVSTPLMLYNDTALTMAGGTFQSFIVDQTGRLLRTGYMLGSDSSVGYSPSETEVAKVAAGDTFVFFLKSNGSLWAKGRNEQGQLGIGSTDDQQSAVQVVPSAVGIAAGRHHSFFITPDHTLWGAGANGRGQLGDGSSTDRLSPVRVIDNAASASAGGEHSLVLLRDGKLLGMGNNGSGQLGTDSQSRSYRSEAIHVDVGVEQAVAGERHTLYLKSDQTLWAMGDNASGQLGDNSNTTRSSPVKVADGVKLIAAAGAHSLFVKQDGSLWAMGDNAMGQLGDLTVTNRAAPVKILTGVKGIAASTYASYYIKDDGTLWMMGRFGYGASWAQPEHRQLAEKVVSVAAGFSNCYYITTEHSLWGVGSNDRGQRGSPANGSFISDFPALEIAKGVSSVTAGANFVSYTTYGQRLQGLGGNASGQLSTTPSVDSGGRAQQIGNWVLGAAAGDAHIAYVRADETLWTLGANSLGQLGTGDLTSTHVPKQVGTHVVSVAAGTNHTAFITEAGTAFFANLSARSPIGVDAQTLIAGFVVAGSEALPVLIRGNGPALQPLGVSGFLPDPLLRLFARTENVLTNDDWSANRDDEKALQELGARLGASPWSSGSKDAAFATSLAPGVYTTHLLPVRATDAGKVGLVELYDGGVSRAHARLVNISIRSNSGAGELVQIAGFVISGTRPMEVLIRAMGGAVLQSYGVTGVLANPKLTLRRGQEIVKENDDWSSDPQQAATISATAERLGAAVWAEGSKDAALLVKLAPGVYTAMVSGADGGTGVALVELFDGSGADR